MPARSRRSRGSRLGRVTVRASSPHPARQRPRTDLAWRIDSPGIARSWWPPVLGCDGRRWTRAGRRAGVRACASPLPERRYRRDDVAGTARRTGGAREPLASGRPEGAVALRPMARPPPVGARTLGHRATRARSPAGSRAGSRARSAPRSRAAAAPRRARAARSRRHRGRRGRCGRCGGCSPRRRAAARS